MKNGDRFDFNLNKFKSAAFNDDEKLVLNKLISEQLSNLNKKVLSSGEYSVVIKKNLIVNVHLGCMLLERDSKNESRKKRYQVLEQMLGKGTFGTVYLSTCAIKLVENHTITINLNHSRVIKIQHFKYTREMFWKAQQAYEAKALPKGDRQEETKPLDFETIEKQKWISLMKNEANLTAMVYPKTKSIVFSDDNKTCYLVMEKFSDTLLKNVVNDNFFKDEIHHKFVTPEMKHFDQSSLDKKMDIICNLLENAYEIHKKGIIHGDIKPPNIIYRYNDVTRKGKAHIFDFGIAVMKNNIQGHGTQGYEPPEGPGCASESRDIYSLGMIIIGILGKDLDRNEQVKNFVKKMCAKSFLNRIDNSRETLDFFAKFNPTWMTMQLKSQIDDLEQVMNKLFTNNPVNTDEIRTKFENIKNTSLLFLPSGPPYSILLKEIETLRSSVMAESISLESPTFDKSKTSKINKKASSQLETTINYLKSKNLTMSSAIEKKITEAFEIIDEDEDGYLNTFSEEDLETLFNIEIENRTYSPGLSKRAAQTLLALHEANPNLEVSFLLKIISKLSSRSRPWENLAAFSRIAQSCPKQINEEMLSYLETIAPNILSICSFNISKKAVRSNNKVSEINIKMEIDNQKNLIMQSKNRFKFNSNIGMTVLDMDYFEKIETKTFR